MTTLVLDDSEYGDARWAAVERCPACGARGGIRHGSIPDRCYAFGAVRVPIPVAGIAVIECGACGLAYKSPVPEPGFLSAVFAREAAGKWLAPQDFADEAAALQRRVGRRAFDLLDVGAASGEFLRACAESGLRGRRSALDVLRYPGLEAHLAGEFIRGRIDSPSLAWSGEPYDVVTVFDVLEHLYQPQLAFRNLRSLVKPGGWVVIETGSTDNFWPTRFGLNQWWYVRLIEHHVFWSRRALERAAAPHGLEIADWEERRHRSRREIGLLGVGNDLLEVTLYCVTGRAYGAIARLFGKQGIQPWYPFAKDHLRVWLRRA
jgi:SAM-dependent methyltransferase